MGVLMKRNGILFGLCLAFILSATSASAAVTNVPARPVRILCKAISTTNISRTGAQMLDTISLVAGDVACVVGESDNKNGAYIVATPWKAIDPGLGTGLELYALTGSANANALWGCDTTGTITWGTTSTVFTLKSGTGGAFDPTKPGPIGGTTPSTVKSTVTTATTSFNLPTASIPLGLAATVQIVSGNAQSVTLVDAEGDALTLAQLAVSGTASITKRFGAVSLANGATYDISVLGLGGSGTVTAANATTSASGSFSYAANGATSANGLTFANFDVADTGAKLCAFASGGNLRIKNNLGSTQTILIDLSQLVAY